MQVAATYRAVQAVSPGKLEVTEKPLLDPPAGHVCIPAAACSVGHSDSASLDAIGEGVQGWKRDQRVGVGFLGGSCGYCVYCRDGDLVNCTNQGYTGVQHDGGYAEMMIAKSSGLIAVPDDLSSVDAAPLLCAGLTTFSALRNSPARAGDLVAVFGVGGLGHLGVQYARRMGFEVVAINRGADRAELSKKLGANHYIDRDRTDVARALQERGGAQVVLATASGGKAVAAALGGLRRGGVMISLGATDEPIELSAFELLFKQVSGDGAMAGTPDAGDAPPTCSGLYHDSGTSATKAHEHASESVARVKTRKALF